MDYAFGEQQETTWGDPVKAVWDDIENDITIGNLHAVQQFMARDQSIKWDPNWCVLASRFNHFSIVDWAKKQNYPCADFSVVLHPDYGTRQYYNATKWICGHITWIKWISAIDKALATQLAGCSVLEQLIKDYI